MLAWGRLQKTASLLNQDPAKTTGALRRKTSLRKDTNHLLRKKIYKRNMLFRGHVQGSSRTRVFCAWHKKDCAAAVLARLSTSEERCPPLCKTTIVNRLGMASPNTCTVVMQIFLLKVGSLLHYNKSKIFS